MKPLVMAGIAGTLSLSLIVTTPSNAQAFVPPPALPGVWGATTMVLPRLIPVAATLGPVGWGALGVAAVGMGIYSTRDYWLPYVTGAFGQSSPSCDTGQFCGSGDSSTIPSPSASATPSPSPTSSAPPSTFAPGAAPGLTVTKVLVNGLTITATFSWADENVSSGYTAIMQAIGSCRQNTTGAQSYGLKSITQGQSNRDTARTQDFTFAPCPAGTTMDGYMVGGGHPSVNPDGSAQQFLPNAYAPATSPVYFNGNSPADQPLGTHGPRNIMSYGVFAPEDTNPRTDATKYTTTVECVKPDGSFVSISAESLGGAGGLTVPSCAAAGLGHGTGKIRVDGLLAGSTQPTKLWDVPRADSDPAMPLCDAKRPGTGCKLGVSLDGQPCVIGNIECENWADLRNDPNHSTRLSCQYGPYQVSMETCNPLERAYEPGGAPATEPNTDGNPGTRDDTQPDGNTQPKPSTDPNAPPITGTAPGGFPSGGTNPAPSTSANCSAPEWSWNPVDFVKNPVVCALQDAFVPKQDVQARSNELRQKSLDTIPIAWLSPTISAPGGGGCPDWTINVAGLSKNVICDSSFTQALLAVRVPLFGLVAAAMIWPLLRSIWYAAIPVLRVNPGSHK